MAASSYKADAAFPVNNMKKVQLNGVIGKGEFVLVDDNDFDKVSSFSWSLNTNGYAVSSRYSKETKKSVSFYLHRFLLGVEGKKHIEVDHINRNKLDNRIKNLRVCTRRDNSCNKSQKIGISGFRGVWKNHNGWQAVLKFRGERMCLGTYEDKKEAAKKWNEVAKKYHGEFAVLNEGL